MGVHINGSSGILTVLLWTFFLAENIEVILYTLMVNCTSFASQTHVMVAHFLHVCVTECLNGRETVEAEVRTLHWVAGRAVATAVHFAICTPRHPLPPCSIPSHALIKKIHDCVHGIHNI